MTRKVVSIDLGARLQLSESAEDGEFLGAAITASNLKQSASIGYGTADKNIIAGISHQQRALTLSIAAEAALTEGLSARSVSSVQLKDSRVTTSEQVAVKWTLSEEYSIQGWGAISAGKNQLPAWAVGAGARLPKGWNVGIGFGDLDAAAQNMGENYSVPEWRRVYSPSPNLFLYLKVGDIPGFKK